MVRSVKHNYFVIELQRHVSAYSEAISRLQI